MAQLKVNGARLEYMAEGRGDPPFVFVHGWVGHMDAWKHQLADLSRDHRVIALNLRGCGTSEPVPPFDATQAADDTAALMRELDLPPAILVGHSLGGIVALLANDRHPDQVLGLVLGDPPFTVARERRMARTSAAVAEAGSVSPMAEYIESFFTDQTPPEVADWVRETMLTAPADVAAGMLSNTEVVADRLEELVRSADRKPLMIFWAERPHGDPRWLRDITMFARQEPMAGAGHFFQLEQPEVTSALLRAFVDDVQRDPRLQRS